MQYNKKHNSFFRKLGMFIDPVIIQGIVERGLIFSLCSMSVYLTSRIIKFDDLSLEGSFSLGGALMAYLLSIHVPWYIALPISVVAGGAAGFVTGILHTRYKLNNLISGIVVTTALFSINLKIATSTMIVSQKTSLFSLATMLTQYKFVALLPLVYALLIAVKWFLKTECGFLLHAVGDNKQILINLGKNPHVYTTTALIIANALTALSGCLFVQYVGYFSIWSGVGTLIIALSSLILSEMISNSLSVGILLGAMIYQVLIAMTFELNVSPEWNKLITAVLIVVLLSLKPYIKSTHK